MGEPTPGEGGSSASAGALNIHLDAGLHPLTAALLECVSVSDVVQTVVDRGISVLDALAGLVALVATEGADLEIVHTYGYAGDTVSKWARFPLDAPLPLSDVVRGGKPLYLMDRLAWAEQYPQLLDQLESSFQASVSLPLSARQRVFGAIHFSFANARSFSEEDRAFLGELARQCALALERALVFQELQRERAQAEQARIDAVHARLIAEASRADAEAAQSRLSFLAQASALLSESLDYASRLERLARLSVPEIADWVGVDILGDDGELVRLSVAHRLPELEDVMRDVQRRFSPGAGAERGIAAVIRTGQPLIVTTITPQMLSDADLDPEHLDLLLQVGISAIICLPLQTRGRVLGAITFGMAGDPPTGSGRGFTEETVALARELADRAAVSVDNARLFGEVTTAKRRAEVTLESIGDMFFALDSEWRFVYVNQRAANVWGYGDDLRGQDVRDVFPQAIGSETLQVQMDVMRERRAMSFESVSPVLHRWIEGTVYPSDEGGISVYFRDIHERKRSEEALRQSTEALRRSETRYRRLLDTALEGILFLDAKATIAYVNRQMARMLGYESAGELIGHPVFFLFFPHDAHIAQDRWQARLMGVQEQYELRLRRKDGSECWAIAHVSIERDAESGEFIGTFTMFTDITDRRQALEALKEKNNEIVTIMESITDAFFSLDHEWRFTHANNEAERVLQRSREELLGRNIWLEFSEAVGTRFDTEYHRAIRDRVSVSFIEYYAPLDTWFDVRAYPSDVGLSVYFQNVNEQRRAQEERERLLTELQEASGRQRRLLREMLSSLTEGHLRLCDSADDLPAPLGQSGPPVALSRSTLRDLRQQVLDAARDLSMSKEREQDFVTAVGEASMNAIVHAGGGEGRLYYDKDAGVVQVWIVDTGKGIAEEAIHRATLEKGYSSAGTLGHGFYLILKTADRIFLLTGPTGTTIVIELHRESPQPLWMQES